jgi:Subtilase family
MKTKICQIATLACAATTTTLALAGWQASAAAALTSQPEAAYSVRNVCAPPAPGHVSCLALELVARTPDAQRQARPLAIAPSTRALTGRSSEPCEPTPTAKERCFGLRPKDLHSAYELPDDAPDTQTIALVDAYNDLSAAADLKVYDEEFGLPACTEENGCFRQVNERGEAHNPPFPASELELTEAQSGSPAEQKEAEEAEGWTLETSLDVETAHAICNSCDITLVEADSTESSDLEAAEETAGRLGATEISNSWGGPECQVSAPHRCVPDSSAFDQPGVVITASAGDSGYLGWDSSQRGYAEFPASSPRVVAVGGTRLLLNEAGQRERETVWNDGGPGGHGAGGGGCSISFEAQPWQQSVSDWPQVGCAHNGRAVADVSADADPYTGVAVYDSSSGECESSYEEEVEGVGGPEQVEAVVHWCPIGGTSLSSPLIAATFALAGGAHGVEYPARTLYENALASPGSLYDVSKGSNGECKKAFDGVDGESGCTSAEEASASCGTQLICQAAVGYDGPTGLGTPNGLAAFEPPAGGESSKEGGGGTGGSTVLDLPSPVAPSPTGPAVTTSAPLQLHLSQLALTLKALIALNASHPRIPQVAFTFLSNLATRLSVSLQKRVTRHRHTRWQPVSRTLVTTALAGLNSKRLSGRGRLSSGTYRLLLTPLQGAAEALTFKIG